MNIAVLPRSNGVAARSPESEPLMARLRLIGQMEAWTLSSENILPTGRKTRALLAVLALSAPRPMLRGKLAELLWSRRPEEQARASLRQEIHRLLDALSPDGAQILTIHRDHLMLRPGSVWIDVEEVMRATPSRPAALALLDGELLEDLDGIDNAFDVWLASERERLRDRARELAEAILREQTEPDTVVAAAQQLLAIDRSHEGAWRALMRAYADRGERGMAIQAYERCRAVLADQLDAQPSEETQRLLAEVRKAAAARPAQPLQRAAFPALSPPPGIRPVARPGVRSESGNETTEAGHEHLEPAAAPARMGPRVGIFPLQFAGAQDGDQQFATGLGDEIAAALACFRSMHLVSSSSLLRQTGSVRDEAALRRNFGIDFLLDGTIQRVRERLRISLRLLDLRAGSEIVWSRRFDREAGDLLTLQDEIASEAAAQLDAEVTLIEAQRIIARPSHEPTAHELVMRARPMLGRLERPLFGQVGDLLRQAIAVEPTHAQAHAWLAYWMMFQISQGWAADTDLAIGEAMRLGERAVMLDSDDAMVLTIAGHLRASVSHRLQDALALHERALLLNPHLAFAWNVSGVAYAFLGDLDEAERRVRRYKMLTPLGPQAFFLDTALVLIPLLKRDHEAAVIAGRNVSEMNPTFSAACKPYLAALGHLGRRQEGEAVRRRLLSIEPDFTIRRFLAQTPLARAEDRDHYAEGLRLAGLTS